MKILEIFSCLEFIRIAKKALKYLLLLTDFLALKLFIEKDRLMCLSLCKSLTVSAVWRIVMKQGKVTFHFSLFHYVPFDRSRFSRILHTEVIVTFTTFIYTATLHLHSFYLHEFFFIIKTNVTMKLRNNKSTSSKDSSKLSSKLTGVKKSKFFFIVIDLKMISLCIQLCL